MDTEGTEQSVCFRGVHIGGVTMMTSFKSPLTV